MGKRYLFINGVRVSVSREELTSKKRQPSQPDARVEEGSGRDDG